MGEAATKGPGFQPMPGIRPERPPVSLLTVARKMPRLLTPSADSQDGAIPQVTGQPGWKGGVAWRSINCVPGYGWPFCGAEQDRESTASLLDPAFYPYMLYVPYRCDWVLSGSQETTSGDTINVEDYRDDARDQLDALTPWLMSNELWVGAIETENPSLMSTATDVSATSGDPVHPVTGLETLLDAFYNCASLNSGGSFSAGGSGVPIVHAPMSVVVSLMANHVVSQQGDVFYGPNCRVSPGPGYPIDGEGEWGPGGEPAGENNEWMFISGPVEYAEGDIDVLPTDQEAHWDRRANTYIITAQRLVIHRFDPCCVYACKVFNPSPAGSAV